MDKQPATGPAIVTSCCRVLSQRPGLGLFLVSVICLLAFWVTIPLPRADHQLVGSDGLFYYSYLPAFWLEGTTDLRDAYAHLLGDRQLPVNADGQPANMYTIGPALLWSPFFLLGHGFVLLGNLFGLHLPTDGCSTFHQAFVLSGSILYGGLALWLVFAAARRFVSEGSAFLAAVLSVCGGNLVYYMTAEPSMSHSASAFLSALFLFFWIGKRSQPLSARTALIYGGLGGLMALVRPQDGLFLALPFVEQLLAMFGWPRAAARPGAFRLLGCGLLAALAALVVFSPQLALWHHFFGNLSGMEYARVGFNWAAPDLLSTLFSPFHGLFSWHPIFLAGLAGLVLTGRRDGRLALVCLLGFVIQWYLVSSWNSYYQGDSFGGRMFSVCLPIFVLGLGEVIEALRKRGLRALVCVGAGVILSSNFFLYVYYRFDLVLRVTPTTWYELYVRRFTFPFGLFR